jgi:membrane protease YdiL (CAAX protease family)
MRLLYGSCKVVQAALPLVGWWLLGMERLPAWPEPEPRPGPPARGSSAAPRRVAAALAGLLSGAALGGLALAAYAGPLGAWPPLSGAGPRIHDRLVDLDAATPVRYLLLAVGLSVAHSLFEEYYWRWFLLGQLRRRLPFAASLTLASLAFAAHHWIVVDSFLGGTHRLTIGLPLTLVVAGAGALWGWLFRRYRTLLAPWLSHLLVDAALMAVGWWMLFV